MFDNRKRKKKKFLNAESYLSNKTKVRIVFILVIVIALGGWYFQNVVDIDHATEAVDYSHTKEANVSYVAESEVQTEGSKTSNGTSETIAPFVSEDGTYYSQYIVYKDAWQTQEDGTVLYKGKHYKRTANVKSTLLLGIDRSDELSEDTEFKDTANAGRTDALILAAQDTARNQVKLLMIPRDTLTDIDVYDDEGNFLRTQVDHINISFIGGGGGKGSCEVTAKAVSGLLCGLDINHYMAMDMSVLNDVTEAVGGVTITIPNDDLKKVDPKWTFGKKVKLNQDTAESFLRFRDIDKKGTPVMRLTQHRAFILGFFDAVKKKSKTDSNIVSKLFDITKDHMITNMQKDEYMKFALDEVTNGSLKNEDIQTLPGIAGTDLWGYDTVATNYDEAIPIILDLFYREIT